jgi:hypothetical protein
MRRELLIGAENYMMMRPRLSRSTFLSLVALVAILSLSYFPLTHTRAANVSASILPSAAKPLVNLKTPQAVKLTYTGESGAVSALRSGTAIPVSLAAGDFNADGAIDVVAGYSTSNGGVLALMLANPDAYAPKDTTLYQKAMKGSVPATFQSKAAAFSLPESPDLIVTGDFNRDGHLDVLVAARGNNLYMLAGDGKGNLLDPQIVPLTGQVTALAATADGHVAVSLDGPSGAQLTILAPSSNGLIEGASYPLPARGDSIAWGNLGGGHDIAVGAGGNIVLIYNALTANPQTETVAVPFKVMGLTIGDFIWDRDGRQEISALADDGSIQILQHGALNTAPLTAADLPGRRAAMMAKMKAAKANPPSPTSYGAWTVAKQLPYTASMPAGPASSSAFTSPRLAAASSNDLMVLDAGRSQLTILDTSGKAASPSAGVSFSSTPVAAFAMPQKIGASRDVVVLTSAQSAPMLITAGSDPTFTVTTTADEDDAGACTNGTITSGAGPDGQLSLREATCEANNSGGTDVINVPAGTYSLTSLETGELELGNSSAVTISIVGAGQTSTIIQQTDGHDRIFEQDPIQNGSTPVSISNLTVQLGTCSTGQDCGFGGGGMLGLGNPGDNLTLANVTFNDNNAEGSGNGGGLEATGNGNLTITNSVFSNNSSPVGMDGDNIGGGVDFEVNPSSGNLSITGSAFTGNTSTNGGGGLYIVATGNSATVSGSLFGGNTAGSLSTNAGGAIYVKDSSLTVSNSRIVGNTAGGGGTGLASEASSTVTATDNWWGCNGGPGASGCDTVVALGGSTATFNPWLVLSVSANPTQVDTGGTSTLTADLTHNSSATSTTLTSGEATSTYTAGSMPGAGSGTATVDNQEVSVTVNIGQPPAITSNSSTTFVVGTAGSFTVTTTGSPTPSISEGGSLPNGVGFTNNGNGTATLSGTPTQGGTFNIIFTAANGVSPNATQSFTLNVNKVSTTTSVQVDDAATSSPWSGTEVTGASAYASSTVSPASGGGPAPTGSVAYTLYGNGTCSGGSLFTFTESLSSGSVPNSASTAPLSRGTYFFQASYSGDSNYTPSHSNCTSFTVSAAPTSIAVTNVSPSSEGYGQDAQVTITAVLSGVVPGFAPTGPVTISGNGPSGTYGTTSCGSPSGNTITCTNTYSPTAADFVGSYTETASYPGDSNYTGSSSTQTGNFSIAQATSSTSVGSSQNPSNVGQSVTFTATIDGENGLIVRRDGALLSRSVSVIKRGQRGFTQKGAHPLTVGGITGTVTWSANTGCSASPVTGDPGTSQCTTTTLPQGTDTITATYSGDSNHSGSTGTLSGGQVVNPVVTSTSIAVTNVSPASEVYGADSAVTITAVLSWTGTGPTPTASDVTIGGTGPSGYSATTCGSPSGDTLTCTATYTPSAADTVGTYTESATFSGDSNYTGSSSTQTNNFSITQATSSTSVGSSQNPSNVGQSVTFTATIDGENGLIVRRNGALPSSGVSVIKRGQRGLIQKGSAHPLTVGGITGTVTWSANTGCSPSTVSGDPGTSQCTTTTLPQGTDTITATYSGDTNHSGSTGTLSGGQVVNGVPKVSLKPISVNFGTVHLSSIHSENVTVTNVGSGTLIFKSVSLTEAAGNPDSFTFMNSCGSTLAPTKSCTITIGFSANKIGSSSATLNIADNAASSPQHVPLSAAVINPRASLNPQSINFETHKVGSSTVKKVTLTNTGTTMLNVISIAITGADQGDFSQTNTCPSSLGAGDKCTISVTFDPQATGPRSAGLTVSDNALVGSETVSLSGTGD